MESQLQRPYGHGTYEDPQNVGLHSVVEDEGEHRHEKKSVLKKVKDKAKKIKDTLKKHGHGHEHDQERDYNQRDHDEDEEEDEDEELVEDPEIHGAPIYESAAVRSAVIGQGVNLEKPSAIGEDRCDAKRSDEAASRNLGKPTAMEVDHAPEDKNVAFPPETLGSKVSNPNVTREKYGNMGPRIGAPEGLEEDPHAPKNPPGAIPPSNYETKVADPTGKGGKEAEITSLIPSFDKMGVSDESVPKPEAESEQRSYTGSHDQFAPQPNPTADEFPPESTNPKSYDPNKPEDLPRDILPGKSSDQSGYIERISTASSVIADKAISAKNVVASKLGYGGSEGSKTQEMGESEGGAKSASPTEYAHKVAATVTEKLAPVYEKVSDAGSSVMSKVRGTGTRSEADTERPDKGVSVKTYLAEKFKPGEEDKALSEVISDVLHKRTEEFGSSKAVGKVTESEEVARQLGSGKENRREGDDARAAGSESSGKGVVDRLKNAVTSWVSKGGDQQEYSQGSTATSYASDEGTGAGEVVQPGNVTQERKLQESAN